MADFGNLNKDLTDIVQQVRAQAQHREGDLLALLELLRVLEGLHREIQDTRFQAALPDNRQALYALLRDIDANGGWPYINRMRLRDVTQYLQDLSASGEAHSDEVSSSS